MLFSGKITNSFLHFLERANLDLGHLFELTDLSTEFLRDPSAWIPAADMERFLADLDREFGAGFQDGPLATLVGHQAAELRAWGVLDSVLKMMQKPQDIYSQPHRFISYFVSPAPPIANLLRDEESVAFDIPISNQEFPLVTEFLRCALEALPRYLGRDLAQVHWRQTRIRIQWSNSQTSILPDSELNPNYRPELMQSVVASLEEAQRKVEELTSQLALKDERIKELEGQTGAAADTMGPREISALKSYITKIRGPVMRLSDYLARAQQLVTILVGQNRLDRQVIEAMKRVDWEYIKHQYPQVTQQAADLLSDFEREVKESAQKYSPARVRSAQKSFEIEM